MSEAYHGARGPKARPSEWVYVCLDCKRAYYYPRTYGNFQCKLPNCDGRFDLLEKRGCRWGREWMMVAAIAVACESDCELHPTEIMKVLRPELYIGPGMVIDEEI